MNPVSGHGTTCTWGTATFLLTSVSVQSGSGGGNEIDMTSMSSMTRVDPDNTGKRLVKRDIDSAFDGEGDVSLSIDFFLEPWMVTSKTTSAVGLKKQLRLIFPANDRGLGEGFKIESKAVLTQMSLGVGVGEFVSGSATFRLSGD
ncbi:MAG: hypothetical protein EBR52_08050 [Microbacteriaceae bacterium]|nr:hypothetical protein [Microbacteriaceae bacterium]